MPTPQEIRYVTETVKSNKPKGLSITRNNNKFSFSWKHNDKDYDDGQSAYYERVYDVSQTKSYRAEMTAYNAEVNIARSLRLSTMASAPSPIKKTKVNLTNITKNTTGKNIEINYSNYYPTTNSYLNSIDFYVRGDRKGYTQRRIPGRVTLVINIYPTWSDYANASFAIKPPRAPTLSRALGSNSNEVTFSWSVKAAKDDHYPFTDFEWQSLWIKSDNTALANGYKLNWSAAASNNTTDGVTSGSQSFTVDASLFNGKFSYTRWFRIRSRGPGGPSNWVYSKFTFANPNEATGLTTVVTSQKSGERVRSRWTLDTSQRYPVDNVKVRYAVTPPRVTLTTTTTKCTAHISCPDNPGWQDAPGGTLKDTAKTDAWTFDLDQRLSDNNAIFTQIESDYSVWKTYSLGSIGRDGTKQNKIVCKLSKPTITSAQITEYWITTTKVRRTLVIQVDNTAAQDIPNSFVAVKYRKNGGKDGKQYCIGIIPAGQTNGTFILPDYDKNKDKIGIGVQAYIASYSPLPSSQSISTEVYTSYTVSDIYASSDINWQDGDIPTPPTLHLEQGSSNSIIASWDWSWPAANSAELSWADNVDAWHSTDGPQTYLIENTKATEWTISGLEVGQWWVRVRLISNDGDVAVYGHYSSTQKISLASAPEIPALAIQPSIVPVSGKVTCSWAYVSTDGTGQDQADICVATIDNSGNVTHGAIIKSVRSSTQHCTLKASDIPSWAQGATINLCVRVRSKSGLVCEGWSAPQSFIVANKPNIAIDDANTSIVVQDVIIDATSGDKEDDVPCVVDLPITVAYTGVRPTDSVVATIVRREVFQDSRPDEDVFHGFVGETIVYGVADNGHGSTSITITKDDLVQPLDDGGKYILTVKVTDTYGQTDEDSRDFDVHWSHQAVMPTATIAVDSENQICKITPIAPSTPHSGDSCDIYRLSIDKPQLIYENAAFGTMYVDPYPTLGDYGGHRIVYKTKNGDYTTANKQYAWEDYASAEGDILNMFATIIDFDTDKVILPYDLSLSTKWNKDFKETRYLGGTILGDWNPGVSRNITVSTRVSIEDNPETINAMRRLASFAGVCNVRTPDGASYHANVDVSEDREEKWISRLASFNLDITRVDTDILDGMTYAEWISSREE